MKQRQNPLEFSLPAHQFILTPIQFQSSHRLEGLYHLQLQKGCQRINQVKEVVQLQATKEFAFQDQQAFTVRAFKQKNMVFGWSLYKYQDGALEFVDMFRFDLSQNYAKYINEIKNYAFQYAKILQYKSSNREYMAKGWLGLKSHLKNQQFRQYIINSTDTLSLCVHIEIKNELDRLAEIQIEKWKASKKMAIKNEKNQDETSAKSHSSIKLDPDGQDQLKPKPKETETNQKEEQEGIMCLPINQLNIKNWTVLSDIIEASNEQSHFHGDRTDRSDRKPSELGLNSDITPKKDFFKTKTYHFVGEKQFDSTSQFRRNNSLEAIKTGSKVQLEDSKEDMREGQDEFTNSSTIVKPQNQSNINNSSITPSKTRLLVFAVFLIFVCFIFPAVNPLKQKLSINDQFLQNNKKIKKNRLF